LGSYCAITNENKKVRQSNRFDPWGNNVGTANFAITARGFTGHEHYPQFKIINMNGRLYDPEIGRFFSPDDYVQNPYFTQNYNRYSYALNNPLKYVDRTGHRYEGYDDYDDDRYDAYDDDDGSDPRTPDGYAKKYPEMYEISGSSSGSFNPDDREYDPYQDFEHPDFDMDGFEGRPGGPDNPPIPPANKGGTVSIASNRDPYTGLWGIITYIWTGGIENGIQYNFKGEPIGIAPNMGFPPVPAFKGGAVVKGVQAIKTLQKGGHTLNSSTLKALNLTQEQGRKAVEALKSDNLIPHNVHGTIMSNGDYMHNGVFIGNIFKYLF